MFNVHPNHAFTYTVCKILFFFICVCTIKCIIAKGFSAILSSGYNVKQEVGNNCLYKWEIKLLTRHHFFFTFTLQVSGTPYELLLQLSNRVTVYNDIACNITAQLLLFVWIAWMYLQTCVTTIFYITYVSVNIA